MDPLILGILIAASLAGLYMAWGIGANDVANAMGTSVGSGALTLKRAVIVAAVLEFAGAVFVGMHVSETVRQGIVDPEMFSDDGITFMLGMMSALIAAGIWLQIASFKGWPVSTTHSIVGAVIGFGIAYGGLGAVHWEKVWTIVASWVISPLLSGTISYIIFRFLLRTVFYDARPLRAARRIAPYLVFSVVTVVALATVFKGLKNLNLDLNLQQAFGVASLVGLGAALLSLWPLSRVSGAPGEVDDDEQKVTDPELVRSLEKAVKHLERVQHGVPGALRDDVSDTLESVRRLRWESQRRYEFHTNSREYQSVEKLFAYLQVLSACSVAFAHGANDVANAVGPLSAVVSVAAAGGHTIAAKAPVPLWVLILGGLGIVVGLATWGWRVMETIGRKITHLTPTRGFSAEFGAAVTIVLASKMGLPISTTHTLVGAVLGVGLARGLGAINLGTMRDVVASWIVTIPAGAFLCVAIFWGLHAVLV